MLQKITSTLSCWLLSSFRAAQAQDSPAVNEHIEKAQKIAGTEWAQAEQFFCQPEPYANKPDDPQIPPTKILDNVYAMGRRGTVVYAITTSDGIILIDSGYADQLDSILLPDMKKLWLDPAKVKYILGHGHGDHFGGARYFQEHYGAHVVLSAADWDLMQPKPSAGGKKGPVAKKGPPVDPPTRDIVAVEGQAITLGDEKVTPVSFHRAFQGRDEEDEGGRGAPESSVVRQSPGKARPAEGSNERRSESFRGRPGKLSEVPGRHVAVYGRPDCPAEGVSR